MGGGIIIFVKNNLNFKKLNVEQFCVEKHFQTCGINWIFKYNDLNLSISFWIYVNILWTFWIIVKLYKQFICQNIVFGDFNVDFLKNFNDKLELCNIFRTCNCYCTVSEPTRGRSCLDNMITNMQPNLYNVSVQLPGFSDDSAIICELASITRKDQIRSSNVFRRIRQISYSEININ